MTEMTDISQIEQRLEALEMHSAHQDNVIEELSDIAVKQWAEITALTERLSFLKGKIQELEAGSDGTPEPDETPPHY